MTMPNNVKTVKRNSLIQRLKLLGVWIHSKVKSNYNHISIAYHVARYAGTGASRKMKLNQIQYHGDIASIEIMIPKYLAEWIEKQAVNQKKSSGVLIKGWLIKLYNSHAERVSK